MSILPTDFSRSRGRRYPSLRASRAGEIRFFDPAETTICGIPAAGMGALRSHRRSGDDVYEGGDSPRRRSRLCHPWDKGGNTDTSAARRDGVGLAGIGLVSMRRDDRYEILHFARCRGAGGDRLLLDRAGNEYSAWAFGCRARSSTGN